MALEDTVQNFAITPFLLPPRSGSFRRSSFTDGRERALVFFWEAPGGRVFLVRTQAPYVIRMIQRRFGANPDGQFGDITRRAIEADGRASGYFTAADPSPVAALGPLMAYALARAVFNGGRVAFPAAMEYPNIDNPVLATNPQGREHTYLGAYDVALGREVPIVQNPQGGVMPSTANEPAPQQPAPQQPAPPQPAPQPGPSVLDALRNTLQNPGQLLGGLGVDAGVRYEGRELPAGPASPASPCPARYIDEYGRCKLDVYAWMDGQMRMPNAVGAPLDFAQPSTYQLVRRGTGIAGSLVLGALGAFGAYAGGR